MCHLGKVHFEHIRFDHVELAVQAQAQGQITVEFDHRQAAQALDQRLGERGQAGADLDHGLARLGRDGVHDGVDDAVVGQEVLAKAFAGNVFHAAGGGGGGAVGGRYCGGSRYST